MKSLFDSILETVDDSALDIPLRPAEIPTEAPAAPEEAPKYNESINVMNEAVKNQLAAETIFTGLELFTEPLPTTYTMEGVASCLQFHEKDIINKLETDANLVQLRSNYGRKTYPWYHVTEPVKKLRKKPDVEVKERKKQGDGTEFSSQMTFIVRKEVIPPERRFEQDIPDDPPIYKFKVFRTGKIQIPGVTPGDICVVIDKTVQIKDTLAAAVGVQSELISMNAVMKNYKFRLIISHGELVDLVRLGKLLEGAPHAYMFVHSREYNKLSLKYNTPIDSKPDKKTRIHVFLSGKIDVLGSFDCEQTGEICRHIHGVISANRELVVVRPDYTPREIPDNVFADYDEVLGKVQEAEYASYNIPSASYDYIFG